MSWKLSISVLKNGVLGLRLFFQCACFLEVKDKNVIK